MSHASILSPVNLPLPSARPVPRSSRSDGWNVLADIEVFIFAVEAELEAMDRERVGVHRRGCKPDLSLRRRVIGLIWMLTFGGMQWRIAGLLSGIPFTTLHTSFARWPRRGLWRRLGQRLALDWRLACGDEVLPSAVVADSRSLRSAPTAWVRGIDGGKLVKGAKLFAVCDKHGSLLDLELQPANTDDRAGVLPMLPQLAALGFQGDLLGDSGFRGAPFAAAALEHNIYVSISPGGTRDGRFLPNGIRWVVERLFAWLSRYRRLNIVYDRAADLFAARGGSSPKPRRSKCPFENADGGVVRATVRPKWARCGRRNTGRGRPRLNGGGAIPRT